MQPDPSLREAAMTEEKPTAAAKAATPASLQLDVKNPPQSTPALRAVEPQPPPVAVTKTSGNVELEQLGGGPGAASEWGGRAAAEDDIPDPEMDVAVELAAAAMLEKKSIYDDALRTTLQRRKGMQLS
jgi:hypothetical protein